MREVPRSNRGWTQSFAVSVGVRSFLFCRETSIALFNPLDAVVDLPGWHGKNPIMWQGNDSASKFARDASRPFANLACFQFSFKYDIGVERVEETTVIITSFTYSEWFFLGHRHRKHRHCRRDLSRTNANSAPVHLSTPMMQLAFRARKLE